MLIPILFLSLPFIPIQEKVDIQNEMSLVTSNNTKHFLEEIYEQKESIRVLALNEIVDTTVLFLNNLGYLQKENRSDSYKRFLASFRNVDLKNLEINQCHKLLDFLINQNQHLAKYPDDHLWIKELLTFHRDLISEIFVQMPERIFALFEEYNQLGVSIFSFLNQNTSKELSVILNENKLDAKSLVQFGSQNLIENIFKTSNPHLSKKIFSELLLTYDDSEKSRVCFKALLKDMSTEALKDLAISCCIKNKPQLAEIIFAHLDVVTKNSILKEMELKNIPYSKPLPGRLGADQVHFVQLGNAKMYFFMDLEKYDLARNMANQTNKNLMCSMAVAEFPLPTVEVAATATMFRKPLGFDKNLNPIHIDPYGTYLIDDYTQKIVDNIEKRFECNISTLTREMNLVVSHDAMRFHRDQLPLQYAYLNKAGSNFPKCYLVQDLTLMDWDMPINSFSGTLMRDGDCGDIFFILQFPNEVTANFTLDAPIYPKDGSPPVYPGPTTLPYHSPYAPVDYKGKFTSGSSTGKRISSVVRGIVLDKHLAKLREVAISLPLNRPTIHSDGDRIIYNHGVEIEALPADLSMKLITKNLVRKDNDQHVELLVPDQLFTSLQRQALETALGLIISNYDVEFTKIIKRTSGFTRFNDLNLNIKNEDLCIIINRSNLPSHYEYTHISEDCTPNGAPWIHMYFLPPNQMMKINGHLITNFCLTPIEEMFYRNPKYDAESLDVNLLNTDFHSEIDLFILRKKIIQDD